MTADESWESQRRGLVRLLEAERAIWTPEVRRAFLEVPRELFVSRECRSQAYANCALPIGLGQTISQPHMVALMTELLAPAPDRTVLEIGTGSGYQAAILSRLCGRVHTVERLEALSLQARALFGQLGYDNIETHVGDGTLGWPEHAPYDGIVVTAGAPEVPETLKGQLREGGCLVVPVGDRYYQVLSRIVREGDRFRAETHGGCVFVKLIGREGWPDPS